MKNLVLTITVILCFSCALIGQNSPKKIITPIANDKSSKESIASKKENKEPIKIITYNGSASKKERAEKKKFPVKIIKTEERKSNNNVSEANITKIIVVRHAEKSDDGTQYPPLSQEGIKRAEKLANYFTDTKIDKLFATPYKRTKQTLGALSEAKKVEIATYNPSDRVFFENFLKNEKGKTSVIAGHSNTAPMIVNGLIKANTYQQLSESEYGKIWVLTFDDEKLIDCVVSNY